MLQILAEHLKKKSSNPDDLDTAQQSSFYQTYLQWCPTAAWESCGSHTATLPVTAALGNSPKRTFLTQLLSVWPQALPISVPLVYRVK